MSVYREAADDKGSFTTASFSLRAQKATMIYYVKDDEQVTGKILDLLGDVEPSGTGGLSRSLPKCHPQYGWLYAGAIGVSGRGLPTRVPSDGAFAQVGPEPTADEYLEWPCYALQVEYGPLAFALLPDDKIGDGELEWIDGDGTKYRSSYAEEFNRFCWVDYNPKADVISATQGQMCFRAIDTTINRTAFSGRPQLRLPGGRVDIHWAQIPYSWITNRESYIARFQGRINQTAFLDWDPGELLYETATVIPYPAPVPVIDQSLGDGVYSPERLCDVIFHCVEAIRVQPDPNKLPASTDIVNKNWIVGGHNLLPHVVHGFLYGTSAGNAPEPGQDPGAARTQDAANKDRWVPTFKSAPFALLFSDPAIPSTVI